MFRKWFIREAITHRPRETVTINSFASDADALNQLCEVNKSLAVYRLKNLIISP